MSVKKATIVIPAYNEIDCIREMMEKFLEYEWLQDFDVIVVDDGSTDGTGEELQRLREQRGGFSLISLGENRGYGAAIKTGIVEAETEFVVITDADNSYPNDCIPKLCDIACNEGYDMVVGARTGAPGYAEPVRGLAKWVLKKLSGFLAGRKIPDLNSGLRVFRKSVVEEHLNILCDHFSFTTTLTLVMLCDNFRVKYEPITYYRRSGKSKIRPIQDTLGFLALIMTTICYFRPMKLLFPPAFVLLTAGVALGTYQVITIHNITDVAMMLVQTGLLFSVLALISDLIVKSRKVTHVRHLRNH